MQDTVYPKLSGTNLSNAAPAPGDGGTPPTHRGRAGRRRGAHAAQGAKFATPVTTVRNAEGTAHRIGHRASCLEPPRRALPSPRRPPGLTVVPHDAPSARARIAAANAFLHPPGTRQERANPHDPRQHPGAPVPGTPPLPERTRTRGHGSRPGAHPPCQPRPLRAPRGPGEEPRALRPSSSQASPLAAFV